MYINNSDEPVEVSIKRFRKEVEKENILKELKDRQYYRKPSLIRKQEAIKLEKRKKRRDRKRSIGS
ncbi:MAG: 30S ribosomal protein S21 [Spirochaetes bacterium]|nr:30S ribosomal protein S21 [Spirochaetota bacterium]